MSFGFLISYENSVFAQHCSNYQQEDRAVARKPRDAADVLFGLKFADNVYDGDT